jgi:SAM-dependent methyltransferase
MALHPCELMRGEDGRATSCDQLIDAHGPAGARTLLDFGCGTGLDLTHFATRFDCIGVELQPQLVDYAHRVRPNLNVLVGDMRTFRLGGAVDVITCLGNSLAYLHDNADLHTAFTTFAAHAHPGTVLIIHTLGEYVPPRPSRTALFEVGGMRSDVTVSTEWDPHHQISTMHRRWAFDDGRLETDHIRRRVITAEEMELHLRLAGFGVARRLDKETNSTAWTVAVRTNQDGSEQLAPDD